MTRPAPPLAPAPVQPAREIVIYRDRNFDGPAVSISRDEPNLRLSWSVNSVRVNGGVWQLCERSNFRGTCVTVSEGRSNLGRRTVQSVRAMEGADAGWNVLGTADITRGRDVRVINIRGNPSTGSLRMCAENTGIVLHGARARFPNNRFQVLRVSGTVQRGTCTQPILLGPRRHLASVQVTATSLGASRGRLRLEGQ
jgi:hypothetical protein